MIFSENLLGFQLPNYQPGSPARALLVFARDGVEVTQLPNVRTDPLGRAGGPSMNPS